MRRILVLGLSSQFGGAESVVVGVINELDKSAFVFHLAQVEGKLCEYTSRISAPVEFVSLPRFSFFTSVYAKSVNRILRQGCYDYVWINTSSAFNAVLINCIKRNSSAKIIMHCHSTRVEEQKVLKRMFISIMHYMNRMKMMRNVQHKLACSEKAGKWMYGRDNDFLILKNSITPELYHWQLSVRAKYRKLFDLHEKRVLLFVGRLVYPKNLFFAIDVMKALVSIDDNYLLLIVGVGPLKKALTRKVEDEGLIGYVKFLGFRDDIPSIMQASDIFLLPSLFEGFPVTLVEAQATGLKCYVSANVTSEIKLTDLVCRLPLVLGSEDWARRIHEDDRIIQRELYSKMISDMGYNIKTNAICFESVLNSNAS